MRIQSLLLAGACVGGCVQIARTAYRRSRRLDWQGRVVMITGASRGLGLVMARQLVDAGAKLAICARNADDLERARWELTRRGGLVLADACDLTDETSVHQFVQSVRSRFGRIDVLINNAGIIQVGPLDTMRSEDFENAFATHFWGPWHLISKVLPVMRSGGGGRIANISSIGGLISMPHMIPYCTSKFALTGFSRGLQAELAHENILVTTVHPYFMRTGSHHNAQFKGEHRAEFTWFSLGASLPLLSMSAVSAAQAILDAIQHGDAEIILAPQGRLISKLSSLFPNSWATALGTVNRFLPRPNDNSPQSYAGRESYSRISPSTLTSLGDRAAKTNNELR